MRRAVGCICEVLRSTHDFISDQTALPKIRFDNLNLPGQNFSIKRSQTRDYPKNNHNAQMILSTQNS
jgi:hypothetical protein